VCHEAKRYRIDDHIYGIFNPLAVLGHKRIICAGCAVRAPQSEQRAPARAEHDDSPTLDRDAGRFSADARAQVRRRAARHIVAGRRRA
jgi:hypothetical protein